MAYLCYGCSLKDAGSKMIQLELEFSQTGNLTLVRPKDTMLESVNDGPERPAKSNILRLPAGRKMIQLELKFSKTGNLTIVRPKETVLESVSNRPEPPTEPYILRLPDEVLTNIFSLAMGPCGWDGSIYYSCGTSIISTCKRFQSVAQRLLYRTILFPNSCGLVPACQPARRFYTTLKSNPLLGTYCRMLNIYVAVPKYSSSKGEVEKTEADDYNLANELLPSLPNVGHFTIQGGFDGGCSHLTWEMLRMAFKHMPFIKNVTFHREGFDGLLVDDIISNVNLPHLEKLSICGASKFSVNYGGEGQDDTLTAVESRRNQVSFHGTLVLFVVVFKRI
jgi:hypothetical protein